MLGQKRQCATPEKKSCDFIDRLIVVIDLLISVLAGLERHTVIHEQPVVLVAIIADAVADVEHLVLR